MQVLDAEEILASFEDTEDMYLPDLGLIDWQSLDYLGWVHPSGHSGFVVLQSPNDGSIRGIRMNRNRRSSKKKHMEMCSWCHHVHKFDGTAMFTVPVRGTNGRHRLGNVLCKDLDCSLRVRNLVEPGTFMRETLYQPARIWRLQQTMHRWFDKANQI